MPGVDDELFPRPSGHTQARQHAYRRRGAPPHLDRRTAAIWGGATVLLLLLGLAVWKALPPPPAGSGETGPVRDTRPRMAGIGGEARDNSLAFTVAQVKSGDTVLDTPTRPRSVRGQFIQVEVTITNNSEVPAKIDDRAQLLYDGMGKVYRADSPASAAASRAAGGNGAPSSGTKRNSSSTVEPGNSVRRILVFDVPGASVPTKVVMHATRNSTGISIAL